MTHADVLLIYSALAIIGIVLSLNLSRIATALEKLAAAPKAGKGDA